MGAEPFFVTSAGFDERPNAQLSYAVCPLDQLQPFIDTFIDLLQYRNGLPSNDLGARCAVNGHPAQDYLRYLEIGNEFGREETKSEYYSRYALICRALKATYPHLQVV
jgi:hypothetical protein